MTHLLPALSWLVTYCNNPVSSIGYFLNTLAEKLASPCNQLDRLVSSSFNLSFCGLPRASIIQSDTHHVKDNYIRTSYIYTIHYNTLVDQTVRRLTFHQYIMNCH